MTYDFKASKSDRVKKLTNGRINGRLPWGGHGRGYEAPDPLIDAIPNIPHRIAAMIQREGGARAEGVGFPRSRYSKSCLTLANLHGIHEDPYFADGRLAGVISTCEKGGYTSRHYISPETYRDLEAHLKVSDKLGGDYRSYLECIENAAKLTGQFLKGRGTHGLKHNFAIEFYELAIAAGKSLESAMLEISRRCSHHRGDVAQTYYISRR